MGMPCRHWYGVAFIHPEVSNAAFELVHMTWRKEFIRHGLDSIAERRTSVSCQAVSVISRRILEEAKPELPEEDLLELIQARQRDIRFHARAAGEVICDIPNGE
jgi:hypothetical protein